MRSQFQKGRLFRELHLGDGAFVIPNPWDIGTARLLADLEFQALATTSAGFAFSLGQRDGAVERDAMIAHISAIASAVEIPVSADLQNGFGDAPEAAAETIRLAGQAGAVGGSIEDATGREDEPIYEKECAADRIRAAAEAAHGLSYPFLLTARAENHLYGRTNLRDTIERLQAYQEAGADVLYAPGLRTREDIQELARSVDRPVNVLIPGSDFDLTALSRLGIKRVSVGSALSRVALGAFLTAAREMRSQGTFRFADSAIGYADLNNLFGRGEVHEDSESPG